MLTFNDVVKITGGKVLQGECNVPITSLITDSRKAIFHDSSLFFAIRGSFHDGHKFIDELYQQGIRQFIVEKEPEISAFCGCNILKVDDTVQALQHIAGYHRSQFKLKVVGITGSNGKTIVKEWLSHLLSWKYNVVKSPKSYNSQIGVPLSVWQINKDHEFGIFEAGISRPGEMEKLAPVIKPQLGIFTNIGSAHDEGFSSREQKIREKLKLFSDSQMLIMNTDSPELILFAKDELKNILLLTWGSKDSDITVNYEYTGESVIIHGTYKSAAFLFSFHFTDKASLENIMHCIAFLLYLNWDHTLIQQSIDELSRVSMRLEMKRGINGCSIIDDTYNNDLISLEIGLNFMASQSNNDKKTLILSDILQSGLPDDLLYENVSRLCNQYGVQKVIGIGKSVIHLKDLVQGSFIYHSDINSYFSDFNPEEYRNEIILVKGARPFEFEKIINALQEKIHGTVLEIDLDAIIFNFNSFRAKLKPSVKIMVMVKALAYGNGSLEIANLMQYHRADYRGVAFADEGVFLRKNGIGIPIMVMNPTPESYEKILEFRLEPEIYSLSMLDQLISFMSGKDQSINIHLKLDTGMHRLGINREKFPRLIQVLKENRNIKVKSIFSHFAASDEPAHDLFTHRQAKLFLDMYEEICGSLQVHPIRHIANTAAILRFPEYHFDMVRLGIGLYGLGPGNIETFKLKPVSTLKTIISQIIPLKPGETVGYGRKGKISRNSKIATIAIGYADGFTRAFSNGKGQLYLKGRKVPVIGNVCMDMSMIDITGIDAKEGDEVIIFGKENSISELASSIKTIPYEILTNISERVKRIYFKD